MIDPSATLNCLPTTLRDTLIKSYREIAANFSEHRWEPSELNGGKFSEAVYSIIEGQLTGKFPAKAAKPKDMVKACRSLENLPFIEARKL